MVTIHHLVVRREVDDSFRPATSALEVTLTLPPGATIDTRAGPTFADLITQLIPHMSEGEVKTIMAAAVAKRMS